jgi:hypothetical protein
MAASVAYFLPEDDFFRSTGGAHDTLEDTLDASSCASAASFMAATMSSRTTGRRFQLPDKRVRNWRLDNCFRIETRTFQFGGDKPGAQYARDLVVIEDIGVDRIDRHDRATGFQDDKVARFENGHF